MGKYSMIKREFEFLTSLYGFKIYMKQKHGAYYYIGWTNSDVDIVVLYDNQINERMENPVKIVIFSASLFGVEFQNEFILEEGSPQERIHCASEWLKNAIADERIKI